jgi:carbamoyl-phosphate synthase large subunit
VSLNVLITAASRRVPLVRSFHRAVQQLGGGTVIVTDVNPLSPAVYAADRAFRVSMASAPGYVEEILAICAAAHVGLVVPTIDDELTALAWAVPLFAAAGVRVAVSNADTTDVCNDKHATCRALAARGVAAAASFLPADLPPDPRFPLFIKPRFGRGSVAAFPVRNARELSFFLDYVPEPVVEEYLDGPEYTIDMLCDFSGQPLSIVPRERIVIRAGVTDRGRTVKDERLIDLAMSCATAMTFAGPVNIQCRMVDGRPVVFEINPRFSGGIPLTIAAGADFPRMLVELTLGCRVPPAIGRFRENVWITNYETAIFLEEPEIRLEPFSAPPDGKEPGVQPIEEVV